MIIKAKSTGMKGREVKGLDSNNKEKSVECLEIDQCEICKKKFDDQDVVIDVDDGLVHEEECFLEYCYELYSIPMEYEEYKEGVEVVFGVKYRK